MLTSLLFSVALGSGNVQEDFHCYLGVLHAHTVLSPDFVPGQSTSNLTTVIQNGGNMAFNLANGPYKAWKRAADNAKIDFLALTDHQHGKEGSAEPCAHEMPTNGYAFLVQCANKINSDPLYQGKFLAIPGMEWNTISAGNHINIFFAKAAVPNSIRNGKFDELRTQYLTNPAAEGSNPSLLVQMNHPNQNSGFSSNYGRPGYTNDSDFVRDFKDIYMGIEHINNSNGGNGNSAELNAHRDGNSLASYYRKYLNAGFRIAPVGDHDNHRANWGRHTAARTGVWATELTKNGFVAAYKARRVFATEDNEMEVAFKCDGHWMGDIIDLPAQQRMTFEITINQRADVLTGQQDDEGPYEFWLFADLDGPGGQEAKAVKFELNGSIVSKGKVAQGATAQAKLTVRPRSYVYLQAKETKDKDASGENADAWTAPIWFKAP